MNEEFENFVRHFCEINNYSIKYQPLCEMEVVWNHQQAKLDAQAEELERLKIEVDVQSYWAPKWEEECKLRMQQAEELKALRWFLCALGEQEFKTTESVKLERLYRRHGLYDEDGVPTPLLTGSLNTDFITPSFNEQASCQPFLTQCPRCNNPHHACDNGNPTKLLTGEK